MTVAMPGTPVRYGSPVPGDVVAGRAQADPVEALVDRDIEHVLLIADAEVAVARIAHGLAGTLLGFGRLDEGHFPAGRVDHEDSGAARCASGQIDAALGVNSHPVAPLLVAKVDERP